MTEDRKNWKRAWCHYVGIGLIPLDAKKNEWCLHHKDPTLRTEDPERYNEWRVEDLVPMLMSEHTRLHQTGRSKGKSEREMLRLKMLGHPVSEETRKKISEKCKGRKIPEDEIRRRVETYRKNHPPKPKEKKERKPIEECGRIWITNGVESHRIPEGQMPQDGWRFGRVAGWKFSDETREKLMKPKSEEHKKNISKGRMGMKFSEDHKRNLSMSHMGNTWSEEQKQKFINSRKGERWFNNGVINVRRKECPEGFTPGRLKTEQNGK